ncbi:MAG: helix-turn-helix transcriptional regulator [Bacteroidales bacterium]|nr:helix-turn-helix transcriptional regulator [Bacteroidales bacterium]
MAGYIIACNTRTMLSTLSERLRYKARHLNIPLPLKLILFGTFDPSDLDDTPEVKVEPAPLPWVPPIVKKEKPKASFDKLKVPDIQRRLDEFVADENNLADDFSETDLARQFGITKSSLVSYFNNHLETDFRTWKSDIRIDAAKRLILEYDKLSLSEISIMVGFTDRSNFHRRFKALTGCTPKQWRDCKGHLDRLK